MPFAGEPAHDSPDAFTLTIAYLDWFGEVVLRRLEGLTFEQQTTPVVPSGWSVLGLVKHSASVRRFWIRHVFCGEEVDFSWPGTAEQEWQIAPGDTTASLREFYVREHENSLSVLRSGVPSAVSARDYGGTGHRPTLAWIALHLLQESARHSGHLDIGRELIDGAVELDA